MATIAYSTSTETASSRNKLAFARVAAAGRLKAERLAAEARRATAKEEAAKRRATLDAKVRAAGAVTGTVKVCLSDGPKIRLGGSVETILDEVEFWQVQGDYDIEVDFYDLDGQHLDSELFYNC